MSTSSKPFCHVDMLTLEAPSKIAADDTYYFYFYLSKKIRLFDVSCQSSDKHEDSHEISSIILSEKQRLSSAAVVVGALRVTRQVLLFVLLFQF